MNLKELSELVQVTVHLKDIINSAGYSKFNSNTISSLKKRMAEFDELFIAEMLSYEPEFKAISDAKAIHNAVLDARQKMGLDQRYPYNSSSVINEDVKQALREMPAVERIEVGKAINNIVAEEESAKSSKKQVVRRNAKPIEEARFVNDELGNVSDTKLQPVEKIEVVVKKEEVKDLPKITVTAPSSNQPYIEDQSLAALLAAERQKVALKKRK